MSKNKTTKSVLFISSSWNDMNVNSRHVIFLNRMQPQYKRDVKPKQIQSVSGRPVLHQTKVMLNTRNWTITSYLNIELLWVWVNTLAKIRSSSKSNWHWQRCRYKRLWKFRRHIIKETKKKDISLCSWLQE